MKLLTSDRSSAHVSAESFERLFKLTQVIDQCDISSSKSRGRSTRATEGRMPTKRMTMIYGAIGRLDLHILKIANSWFDLHNHLYQVYKYFNMIQYYVILILYNSNS